jgi:hypothetical protein
MPNSIKRIASFATRECLTRLSSSKQNCLRLPRTLSSLACGGLGALQIIAMMAGASHLCAQDVTTWHYDNARTGVQPKETVLTPSNVNATTFGKVFSLAVNGDVYAQPLYLSQFPMADGRLHNVLFVATNQDSVYAFDADGNNPAAGYLWRKSMLGAGETWVSNLIIGVIGTPVLDRSNGTIYVSAKSVKSGTYIQRLHALNIADGSEKLNGPTIVQATVKGLGGDGTTVSFSAKLNNQRSALLLAPTPSVGSGNSVFIAWASHGDNGAYHGWVIAYDANNIASQTAAWTDTPNGTKGGIWMSGGGLSSDNAGNIFGGDGNGTFDENSHGGDYGDSAMRWTVGASGLVVSDYFTPGDQRQLDAVDNDMGTSALTLLPNQSGALPHLMVTSDKSGRIYLLNRDKMGGYITPGNSSVQNFKVGGFFIHSSFTFFNNVIYMAPDSGPLQAWAFNPTTELFSTTPQSKSGINFGCSSCDTSGSTASVSANGASNGIVWALDNGYSYRKPAILHAFDPANLNTEFYNSSQAANGRDTAAIAIKFTTPTIASGRVYVGGRNAVAVYGMLGKTEE